MGTKCLAQPVPGVINRGPGPPGWWLGVRFTTPPHEEKCLLETRNMASESFDGKDATYARNWKEQSRDRGIWKRSIMEAKAEEEEDN